MSLDFGSIRINNKVNDSPIISVILPFYNRIDVVLRAIDSVEGQTYKNWELIVINDGSTDTNVRLVEEKLSNITNAVYINSSKNSGPSFARNRGMQQASGAYIAFLDSDDEWLESKLEVQIAHMLKKSWLFSHTSYWRKDSVTATKAIMHTGKNQYRYPWVGFSCRIATPTVIVHQDSIVDIFFDERLRVAEDQIFWSQLAKKTTLHGIDIPLTIVNTNELTTAKNFKLQSAAQKNVRNSLFAQKNTLYIAHYFYSCLRLIYLRLHSFFGV
jgi:teichuronic acid biosynthesis glycosyltransferase TuaG